MYSKFTYKLIFVVTRVSTWVGAFCAHFDKNVKLICVTERSQKKFFTSIAIYLTCMTFLVGGSVKLVISKEGQQSSYYYATYGVLCLTGINYCVIATFCSYFEDLLAVGNRILTYFPRFASKFWIFNFDFWPQDLCFKYLQLNSPWGLD